MWHGVQFLASYTWSKSIDNASGQGGGAGVGGVLNPGAVGETVSAPGDPFNARSNRGVSDFDRTHRFVLSYIVDIPKPAFARDGWTNAVLGDWGVAGITTWMSGLPIDIVDTGSGSFYGFSGGTTPLARPNLVSDPFKNVPAGFFFNPAAFQRPIVLAGQPIPSSGGSATAGATGTDFGTLGRNAIRGPRQTNFDFSVTKHFKVTERTNVEFRTDFFNLFNHVNYANPLSDFNAVPASALNADGTVTLAAASLGTGLSNLNFGRILSASSNPRLIQFGLKLKF
jgi:hypothetical protein